MSRIISTHFYIDKYQYAPYAAIRTSRPRELEMDQDTNIAAWMIANGLRSTDAATIRNREHLRALNASRPTPTRLVSRLAAAIGSFRSGDTHAEPACCPA
jgi:hypothetical protein